MASRSRANSTVDATEPPTEDIPATTDAERQQLVLKPSYTDDTLRGIASFEDAMQAAGYMFGDLQDAADVLGNGFTLLSTPDAKASLVGKPMVLLEWNFHTSAEFGGEFVSILAVVHEANGSISKVIINDGSTGVCQTLQEFSRREGRQGGLVVRRGLRESTYPFCDDCRQAVRSDHTTDEPGHKVGRARTFYIDASK